MTKLAGSCPDCGGKILAVDPVLDRVLYGIFGDTMSEHLPGCPEYPQWTEMPVEDL